jgi:hypothetical protein
LNELVGSRQKKQKAAEVSVLCPKKCRYGDVIKGEYLYYTKQKHCLNIVVNVVEILFKYCFF